MKDKILRRAYLAQGVGATIDGIALSSAVLYFSVHVGIAPGAIGLVLTLATLLALLLVVPIGIVADAIGLKVAAIALSALVVVAFAAYALAQGVWLYAVLWPPAAELVLLEHVVLHDLRDEAHTGAELPFGAPSPRLSAA